VETVETATFWSNLPSVYAAVRGTLADSLNAPGAPALVLCHISHIYPTGAALYFTVVARPTDDPLRHWTTAKAAVSTAIVTAGGTISHHHAIGRDHKPWLVADIGEVGIEILRAVKGRLDPAGVLNPGVLIP
jgi:alkyldihydroxyacetonephosphate synthase